MNKMNKYQISININKYQQISPHMNNDQIHTDIKYQQISPHMGIIMNRYEQISININKYQQISTNVN